MVEELAKIETEMQEYIAKTDELQGKIDSLFGIVGFIAGEEILDAGKIGDNIYYVIYGNGLAELIGSGETYDFSNGSIPSDETVTPLLNNTSIKNLMISEEITYLGNMLFYATGLTSVEISVNTGYATFGNCADLKIVRVNCEEIGDATFFACTNLESVTISTAVNKIWQYAFTYSIQEINYKGALEQWTNIQKDDYWADKMLDFPQSLFSISTCADFRA